MDLAHQLAVGDGAGGDPEGSISPIGDPGSPGVYEVPPLDVDPEDDPVLQERRQSQRRVSFTYDMTTQSETSEGLKKLQEPYNKSFSVSSAVSNLSGVPGDSDELFAAESQPPMLLEAASVDDIKDPSDEDVPPPPLGGGGAEGGGADESEERGSHSASDTRTLSQGERFAKFSHIYNTHGNVDDSMADADDSPSHPRMISVVYTGDSKDLEQRVFESPSPRPYDRLVPDTSMRSDISLGPPAMPTTVLSAPSPKERSAAGYASRRGGGGPPSSSVQSQGTRDYGIDSDEMDHVHKDENEEEPSSSVADDAAASSSIASAAQATRLSLEDDEIKQQTLVWFPQSDAWQVSGVETELLDAVSESGSLSCVRKRSSKGWSSAFGRGIVSMKHCLSHGIDCIEWTVSIDELRGRHNDVVIGITNNSSIGTLEMKKRMREHLGANFSRYAQGFGFDNRGLVFNQSQKRSDKSCEFKEGDRVAIRLQKSNVSGVSAESPPFLQMSCRVFDPFAAATVEDKTVSSTAEEWIDLFDQIPTVDEENGMELEYRLAISLWTADNTVSLVSCRMGLGVESNSFDEANRDELSCFERESMTNNKELQPSETEIGAQNRVRRRTVGQLRTKVQSLEEERQSYKKRAEELEAKESEYLETIERLQRELEESRKPDDLAPTPLEPDPRDSPLMIPTESNPLRSTTAESSALHSGDSDDESRGSRNTYVDAISKQLSAAEQKIIELNITVDDLTSELNAAVNSKIELVEASSSQIASLRKRIHELCTELDQSRSREMSEEPSESNRFNLPLFF